MEEVFTEASAFVMAYYGHPQVDNMSLARYSVWLAKMSKKNLSSAPPLKCLPPSTEAFHEHVKRAHYQAALWFSLDQQDPPDIFLTHYGWILDHKSRVF